VTIQSFRSSNKLIRSWQAYFLTWIHGQIENAAVRHVIKAQKHSTRAIELRRRADRVGGYLAKVAVGE
jgi:hypothetical protein